MDCKSVVQITMYLESRFMSESIMLEVDVLGNMPLLKALSWMVYFKLHGLQLSTYSIEDTIRQESSLQLKLLIKAIKQEGLDGNLVVDYDAGISPRGYAKHNLPECTVNGNQFVQWLAKNKCIKSPIDVEHLYGRDVYQILRTSAETFGDNTPPHDNNLQRDNALSVSRQRHLDDIKAVEPDAVEPDTAVAKTAYLNDIAADGTKKKKKKAAADADPVVRDKMKELNKLSHEPGNEAKKKIAQYVLEEMQPPCTCLSSQMKRLVTKNGSRNDSECSLSYITSSGSTKKVSEKVLREIICDVFTENGAKERIHLKNRTVSRCQKHGIL